MSSKTRPTYGRYTLKSSAPAPKAMSYMGQDFIANHMKSHYRRILSAKAAVDTSPPKSMKAHIKAHDQKKRATLESRSGTPSSLRAKTPSVEFLSSSHNESPPLNSTRNWQSPGHRQSTGTPLQRSLSMQSLGQDYTPAVCSSSPRDEALECQISTPVFDKMQSKPPVSPIRRHRRQNTAQKNCVLTNHTENQRTNIQHVGKSDQSSLNNLDGNFGTLLSGTENQSFDLKNLGTVVNRFGEESSARALDKNGMLPHDFKHTNRSTRYEDVPSLDLTNVQYSYRGPPSRRTVTESPGFKANMWEEEQKYLKFISDVTTDILARGIFSNRVLKQVFEMHIERRKDKLDESRLQEMIEQLKEDLGVTDS